MNNDTTEQIKQICAESPGQMSYNERTYIYNTLSSIGCNDLLVFGAGNDSKLWSDLSTRTAVLEHDSEWINKISKKFEHVDDLNFYQITYNKFKSQQECVEAIEYDIEHKLKSETTFADLHKVRWNAIIVDGPTGWNMSGDFYRAGSIRLASLLAFEPCHVFVHDVNRHIEKLACDKYFKNHSCYNVDRLNYYQIS